jgi:SAM-dependent methyltransferase
VENRFRHLRAKILSGRVYPEFFPLEPGDRVINLGCGEGPQAIAYAGRYGCMVGVDVNPTRVATSLDAARTYGVRGYAALCADVEALPFRDESFDKAIAVDVIEHVRDPKAFCTELARVLTRNGQALLTFPAMHDRYVRAASALARAFGRRRRRKAPGGRWDPDAHNHDHPLREWIRIVEQCGLTLLRSRASTLFPPLHLYGVPRFWFSNEMIHRLDAALCNSRLLRNCGQALVGVFSRKPGPKTARRTDAD